MDYRKAAIGSLIVLGLLPACTLASLPDRQAGPPGSELRFQRDPAYEQDLRYEASADQTITPAKVIRWIMGLRGDNMPPPSSTEFQPILNAHDGRVRIVAAIAYKF